MEKQTFGGTIAKLRREKGMTQAELAEKMCVTDKAVSKWERDLSFPDVGTIPKLAQLFNVSTDELMMVKKDSPEKPPEKKPGEIVNIALKGIALAMGVAAAVLSFLDQLQASEGLGMLGIGLAALAIAQLGQNDK